ncbi:MAG TPA: hypothetical protein VFS19_01895, partial [Planctomycetota bacterium]|nr:hypothetical protein [Planctomycetota bacterium]
EVSYGKYPRLRDILRLSWYSIAENFGYRQLTVWWRLKGIWQVFMRREVKWGQMVRKGFSPKPEKEKIFGIVPSEAAPKPEAPAPIVVLSPEDSKKFKMREPDGDPGLPK